MGRELGRGKEKIFFGLRIFFYRREGGEEKFFFLGRGFFYRREGGKEKIFFLDREFFYREAVNKFFLGAKDFFTGRGEGFKSRLCLKFGGKGRGKKNFFLGAQGFFYRKGRRFQKSSLLEIFTGGG
jgi:hypothetical protein